MNFSYYDKIKKFIKLMIGDPFCILRVFQLRKKENNRAVLIGTPIHGNLGDHLIAQQALKYIESLGYEKVIEITEFCYEIFDKRINVQSEDTIFINGGGWMGNIYEDQLVIEHIIDKFSSEIVILPQTVSFSGSGNYSSVEQFNKILKDNVILSLREKKSYEFCKQHLNVNDNNLFLVPDMALLKMNEIVKKNESRNNRVLFSIRNDKERICDERIWENIRTFLKDKGYLVEETNTVISKKIVPLSKRESYISDKIEELRNADLVITDRLHSVVFALISGTKCIAFDNSTNKVSGVCNTWLTKYRGLWFADNPDSINMDDLMAFIENNELPESVNFYGELAGFSNRIKGRKK